MSHSQPTPGDNLIWVEYKGKSEAVILPFPSGCDLDTVRNAFNFFGGFLQPLEGNGRYFVVFEEDSGFSSVLVFRGFFLLSVQPIFFCSHSLSSTSLTCILVVF